MDTSLHWIKAGQPFRFDDIVFWQDAGRTNFAQAAGHIDTVVLGPHASAGFPAELQPFINPALGRRKQFDYSDVITSTLGRLWAAADPHVVFIENPHSRLVLDMNRAPPADALAGLREFKARLALQRQGQKPSFAGIDAIRPITFSGEDVLQLPSSETGWAALGDALAQARALGPAIYQQACHSVLSQLVASTPGRPLRVISLHDTMNTKMRHDGAIVVERPEADRLPPWANLGNRGDANGNASAPDDPITLPGAALRQMAQCWSEALGPTDDVGTPITLNQPYKGAYETVHWGAWLQSRAPAGSGAVQVEFRREALLGPAATLQLHQPGADWPAEDTDGLQGLALKLARAGQTLRQQAH